MSKILSLISRSGITGPVKVKTSDSKEIEIPEKMVKVWTYFKKSSFVNDYKKNPDKPHTLTAINADQLNMMMDYFEHHSKHGSTSDSGESRERARYFPFEPWDHDFFLGDSKRMPFDLIVDLCAASETIGYPAFNQSCCRAMAYIIQGKKPEDVRKLFKIENDFQPKEEEEIRAEILWAEEFDDQLRMRK